MTENVDLAEVRRLIRCLRTATVYEWPYLLQQLAAAVPEPTPQMPVVVTPDHKRRRFY